MDQKTEALQREVAQLRREMRLHRAAAVLAVAGVCVFAAARPGVSRGSGGGPLGDRDNSPVENPGRMTAQGVRARYKPLTVLAPLRVVDTSGRILAQIGRGQSTGSGYLETYDTAGNALTFSGSATGSPTGIVAADNAANLSEARLSTDATSGRVQTYNSDGNLNYTAP